ncbi:MAG: hypothetical protein NXI24_15230 [bacterium]|nr:hypothetical protein [bacterium]
MTIDEISKLAAELAAVDPDRNQAADLSIDTFHHPYLQFPDQFTLPTVNLYGIEYEQARCLLAPLIAKMPGFVHGCHVLPEPRPIKENNYLHLVRACEIENRKYIYLFKILAQYLGGAKSGEILEPAKSGVSATVRTDRVYFQSRLIPVEQIQYDRGYIVDFRPVRLRDALLDGITRAQGFHVATKEMRVLDMFDEIDYSQANEELTNMFSVGTEWAPGKVFRPFMVDYHTLTMNLVFPDRRLVDGLLTQFHHGFDTLLNDLNLDGLSAETRAFWAAYYQAFSYERKLSRSSNPHWQLTEYPDREWLAAR